ncbi:GtrA family protein [Coriobacteriia bacterium Es71-Z0120]|uniref:GtrA family protein n=1 Tax=Parvivirga hydrogeniphila TaxID=2939460 RepID=UPI0022608230|nr:GtrA family protein [Parvivirga hydrogeniphila]MCL4079352.1 GtrA family protein [Parvivirga hydrogeniphila]
MSRVLRFGLVGVANTFVTYVVFVLLNAGLGADPATAHAAGWTLGVINSFVLNRSWTFKDRDSSGRAFVRFIAANAFVLLVGTVAIALLKGPADELGRGVGVSQEQSYAGLEALVLVPSVLLNYLLANHWVFRKPAAG